MEYSEDYDEGIAALSDDSDELSLTDSHSDSIGEEQKSKEVLKQEIASLKKKMSRANEEDRNSLKEDIVKLQNELQVRYKKYDTKQKSRTTTTNYKQAHDKRMKMKLKQKHLRDGNGCASIRFKSGAAISEKQWARLDDKHREMAVKSGALPPYKVAKKKKKKQQT